MVERVVVLGAGVMGAQIAALAANAGLQVDLLDLPEGDDPAGRARAAIERLGTLRPAPLYTAALAARIRPGSFDAADQVLGQADWVIEAIVEDLGAKQQLLGRLAPCMGADTVVSSNTSGLSIAAIGQGLPAPLRKRFFGVHFFNPPRYMKLVEIIPGPDTDAELLRTMSNFVGQRLGKGVVSCIDTPNFIANRLGVFALVDAVHRMTEAGLSVEQVDAATGVVLGRPRSATLRLCDLIGLDTLLHVAATSYDGLEPHPGHDRFAAPAVVQALVAAGHLGVKTGGGFYRKQADGIEALQLPASAAALEYRPATSVDTTLPTRGPLAERIAAVMDSPDGLGAFAREHLMATLAYSARCAAEVAHDLEDVDRALRWGFNWEAGPFELIDLIGAGRLQEAMEAAGMQVPSLISSLAASTPNKVYADAGVLTPGGTTRQPRQSLTDPTDAQLLDAGEIMAEADGMRLVYLGDGAAAVELRGKLNTLPPDVLQHVRQAIDGEAFEVLVLTGAGGHFSAGADLKYVLGLIDAADWDGLESYLQLFQATTTAVRYASVPVVAAARGLALGGGCELCLTSAARVVAGELRMGLVETRVGVIPGAGGCKEMVRRVGASVDKVFPVLQRGHMTSSALEAQELGFLQPDDIVLLDEERLLTAALDRGRSLVAEGWQSPQATDIEVAGPEVLAAMEEQLERGASEGDLQPHDVVVGQALAWALCGGGDSGPLSEKRLLELEREAFVRLCGMPATRARIDHMLRTGKPLKN